MLTVSELQRTHEERVLGAHQRRNAAQAEALEQRARAQAVAERQKARARA